MSKSSSSLQAGWSRFRRSDKSSGGGSARGSAYFGGADGAAADGGRRGSGATVRLAQYVWRVHRFGANELLWCVLTDDNHLALHTPAAEPTAAPPVFSLHLASVTTLSEALDRPGCLTISARAMPLGPLSLLFNADEELDRWRLAIRDGRRECRARAEEAEAEAEMRASLAEPSGGSGGGLAEPSGGSAGGSRTPLAVTLTRELAKIFTSFGMDRTALETSSHRGVRTSWVPSQHELASLAEVECGQIHDAAHDDADVADAANAADADAETDGDVHDVRRLGASTTDVGTHRVSDLLPEAPPEDLVLDCDGRVKAGSAVGLIERLASHKFDHRFCAALLLTYRSFYSPKELMCALVARYHIQPPAANAGTPLHDVWVNQRQLPVQLMVCNVLHKWISHYLYDDDVTELLPDFTAFVDGPLADSARVAKLGALLKATMAKKQKCLVAAENGNGAGGDERAKRREARLRSEAAASPLRRGAVLAV